MSAAATTDKSVPALGRVLALDPGDVTGVCIFSEMDIGKWHIYDWHNAQSDILLEYDWLKEGMFAPGITRIVVERPPRSAKPMSAQLNITERAEWLAQHLGVPLQLVNPGEWKPVRQKFMSDYHAIRKVFRPTRHAKDAFFMGMFAIHKEQLAR